MIDFDDELEEVPNSLPYPIPSSRSSRKINLKKRQNLDGEGLFSNINYLSAKEIFGIDNWISMAGFSTYHGKISSVDFVKSAATSFFGQYPSAVCVPGINIFSVIKELKNLGKVEGIFSGHYNDDKPSMICLYIEVDDQKFFLHADNINYESTKGFKGYLDSDLVQGLIPIANIIFYVKNDNTSIYPILSSFSKYHLESEEESYVDMIIATQIGLGLRSIALDAVEDFDLNLHYGENFQSYNEKLLERLDHKDKGIVMFHGPPGTGKTHYIRSLIPKLIKMNKRVILIPKHVLSNLESPTFNSFMIENFTDQRIVFIIEDAESIVAKRESSGGYRSELVSTLLNITDGILNDIFNVQVILTFNTELSSIDDALLRKGRLISKYEFVNLDVNAAKRLGEKIGVNVPGDKKSYSLAEIYSLREAEEDDILINQNIPKEKTFVGF